MAGGSDGDSQKRLENQEGTSLLGPSARSQKMESFKVMEVMSKAFELEAKGRSIIHLEIGLPRTPAPQKVIEAGRETLGAGSLGYTSETGVLPLRERISQHYMEEYGVEVPTHRIFVTTGSSAAFPMAFLSSFDVGDKVAVASSSYPCYRHVLNVLGCEVVTVPLDSDYKVTAGTIARTIDSLSREGGKNATRASGSANSGRARSCPVKGLILSSPSNPTGAMLSAEETQNIVKLCKERGIMYISDEIYHGIWYDGRKSPTALTYTDQCFVINSFSKYYSMAGWRLGWMVVPEQMVKAVANLAMNLFICAPTLSQLAAAKAAFDCDDELRKHVESYTRNRGILLKALAEMGFTEVAPSEGAFYVYVDTSKLVEDSTVMAYDLLEEAGVAITPGLDFEDPESATSRRRIRVSFCGTKEEVEEGMARMKKWWTSYEKKEV